MAEQKLFIIPSQNKNWWGQCKCKKVSGTKIGGHCRPLGDGDPKCKCKKVSGTKIGERNKNGGTKIGGQNKKKVSRTKIGGHCWPLGDGDPKCKCKKVSGTKIGERNKNGRTKNWWAEQKKGQRNKNWWALSAIGWWGPQVQVQKGQQNKNWWVEQKCGTKIGGQNKKRSAEQKLVGTVGHWVTGTPSASAKGQQNKNWWAEQKKVSRTKIGGHWVNKKKVSGTKIGERNKKRSAGQKLGWLDDGDPKCSVQKGQRNKNWWLGRTKIGRQNKNSKVGGSLKSQQFGFQKLVGTSMAIGWWGPQVTKRSQTVVSAKIGEQNKNGGTKIGGRNKKKVSGTKIGGHSDSPKQKLGDGDPKCKCKKVSGTKIGERNK